MEQFIEQPQALPEFPVSSYANLYLHNFKKYTTLYNNILEDWIYLCANKTHWDKGDGRITLRENM